MNAQAMSRPTAQHARLARVALVTLSLLVVVPDHANAANLCRKTAEKAFKSCQLDASEDAFLAQGVCTNFSDGAARTRCGKDARAERKDMLKTCKESRAFRLALCKDLGPDAYDPSIVPSNFLSPAEAAANPNPYLSLVPGTVRMFRGGDETVVVTVTSDTRVIQGVTTTIVSDIVSINGRTVEVTHDYYAQDRQGNVWYFGERVLNYDAEGYLEDIDGSFIAGVDGAKAGIAMKGDPRVGDKYRQEFALREAEDIAEILDLAADENAAAASCNGGCMLVEETLPGEPDVVEHKYYLPGIGFILAIDQENGQRSEEIVDMIDP
jgi:hypothetical protein